MWVERTRPEYGTVRIVSRFLFWPKTVTTNDYKTTTTRWLTSAVWEETYTRGKFGGFWKFNKYIK